jgi:hypothetical protein
MKYKTGIILLIIFGFLSCNEDRNSFRLQSEDKDLKIVLEKKADTLSILKLYVNDSLNSSWPLKYPVYQFDHGDIAGSGTVIAVGVIKSTRFDPKTDKRLFLFKITEDYYIRPLWLGSRVGQPLEDFKIMNTHTPALIRTIEKEQNGTFLVAEYKWHGFGLEFIHYIRREIPLKEAERLLQNE